MISRKGSNRCFAKGYWPRMPKSIIMPLQKNVRRSTSSWIGRLALIISATSGLMIIAKSNICHNELSKIDIEKYYLCLVHGHLQESEMLIEKNIKREDPPSILRYIDKDGQIAKTIVKEIKRYEDKSLVEAKLITGRCHQIRLHLASIGNPIVGDKLYGKAEDERLCLHAYHLKFIHPFTSNVIDIYDYPDFE